LDSLRSQAYVYSLSVSEPVKNIESTPGGGIYALDDVEAFLRTGSFRYEQGNLETALSILRRGRGILATPSLARRYNVGVGDEIMVEGKRGRVPFQVAAVGGTPWWGPVVERADAEAYLGVMPPIGYFVEPKPGVDTDTIGARLREGLATQPDYQLFELGRDSDAFDVMVGQLLDVLMVLLNGLTALALVIASLGQINTMMASVVERVRELAVLRSVGMTRGQVQALVLLEAATVGVVGAIIGVSVGAASVLAYALMLFVNMVEAMGFGAPTWASVSSGVWMALCGARWVALFGLVFAPLMTMLAAWLPAHRAVRLSVVEAIRN